MVNKRKMAAIANWWSGNSAGPERFREKMPLERRQAESARVRERYSDRIPVIVEKASRGADIPDLDKSKFLVPAELTVGQLVYVIRSRLSLSPETALFVYSAKDGSALPTSSVLRDVDERHKDEDGFLYISYSGEATFG